MIPQQICTDRLLNNYDDFEIKNDEISIIKITGQKVYLHKESKDESNKQKLLALVTEYNLQCKLFHPSIQYAIGFIDRKQDNYCTLVTPYCENGPLHEFLSKSSNNTEMKSLKYIICLGIAMGIEYLHNNNILHGNIRPSKILLDKDNRPILIGFGTPINEIHDIQEGIEVYRYSAPEILRGQNYDRKSDVYSFGLIVNHIYSGNIPFLNKSYDEMISIKSNADIEIDRSMPNFLRDIVLSCLNPDKDRRLSFSDIFMRMQIGYRTVTNLNFALISQYIDQSFSASMKKSTFRIPHQLLKLPDENQKWDKNTPNPIKFDVLNNILNINDEDKVIFIMVIGRTETGKSTFLQNLTGNLAYLPGNRTQTTTLGIHIDGPYHKDQLIDNIYDDEFKEKFNFNNIQNDTKIFFLDCQGIGDPKYNTIYSAVLNKIFPIFCFASTACISIIESNDFDYTLPVIKIIRKMQLINNGDFTPLFLLVKGYPQFNNMADSTFNNLQTFKSTFLDRFTESNPKLSNSYPKDSFIPLCLGNLDSNLSNYVRSVWYSLYNIFILIDQQKLLTKKGYISILKEYSEILFSESFNEMEDCIVGLKCKAYEYDKKTKITTTKLVNYEGKPKERLDAVDKYFPKNYFSNNIIEIIKLCISSSYYISDCVCVCLEESGKLHIDNNELLDNLVNIVRMISRFILPFFFGNYDIWVNDFAQFTLEIEKDINSYMKSNYKNWETHMKLEKNSSMVIQPALIAGKTTLTIPVVNLFALIAEPIIAGVWALYSKIQKNIRNAIRLESFKTSVFPFIWNDYLQTNLGKEYDIASPKSIGNDSQQLIIFYEQLNSDSSLIFRALTGFNVDFSNDTQICKVFYDVPIKSMLNRYKRNNVKKEFESKLLDSPIKKVNILYIKGFSQNVLNVLNKIQSRKPIFVSSIKRDVTNIIVPPKDNIFYYFVDSKYSYKYLIANREYFIRNINESKEIIELKCHGLKKWFCLPTNSDNFKFDEDGPVTHALIKLGCRFILQDKSFEKYQQPKK